MDKNFSGIDLAYMIITIMYTFFGASLVSALAQYYESNPIPHYKLNVIQHNLESTPIIDIISGEQCENGDISNILGYYYGFDSGFIYENKYYSEDYRKSKCKWKSDCTTIKAHRQVPFNYFKNQRLCASKRPNKNYFDYIDSSVDSYGNCPKDTRKCGRLDKYRNLCINTSEKCPINDIVYNNDPIYVDGSITYKTVQINENEYLHYTNEKTNNYIITNLTVIGGADRGGFPCGSNDNKDFRSFAIEENNDFCIGVYTSYKYYYFKNLSTIPLKDFYENNDLDLSDLPEYENLTKLGNMTLFSTGFLSLNEEDIKNLKEPNGLEKNNDYSKSMEKNSFICFVTIIVIGVYGFFIITTAFAMGNTLVKLIVQGIFLCLVLLINICGIIEIALNNYLFELTGYFPEYLLNLVGEMKNDSGNAHFWAFFPLSILNIAYFIIKTIKCCKEKKKDTIYTEESQINLIEPTPNNIRTFSECAAPPIQYQNQYSKPTPYY